MGEVGTAVGEYLGSTKEFNQAVLEAYLGTFRMRCDFLGVLRTFLESFKVRRWEWPLGLAFAERRRRFLAKRKLSSASLNASMGRSLATGTGSASYNIPHRLLACVLTQFGVQGFGGSLP